MNENLINETQGLVDDLKVEKKSKLKTVKDYIDEVPDANHLVLLGGLQNKNTYQGTVSGAEKEKRRAKNKRARAARRRSR